MHTKLDASACTPNKKKKDLETKFSKTNKGKESKHLLSLFYWILHNFGSFNILTQNEKKSMIVWQDLEGGWTEEKKLVFFVIIWLLQVS